MVPQDHLSALGNLVDHAFPDPTGFFDHGLALLIQQLGVNQAVMSRLGDLGWEIFWWATVEGTQVDGTMHEPVGDFCSEVLEHPARVLTIRDTQLEDAWKNHPVVTQFGIRCYMGTLLQQDGKVMGVLSVMSKQPKAFNRAEVAMLKAMANLFSKTLEVEHLKHELHLTRDTLDLTTAVVEDSALENAATRLPNRHYLDIWLRANLYLARRRGEAMTVVCWHLEAGKENRCRLQEIADRLRGEDLLVDMGHEEFLLLLPRTPKAGACVLLDRIRGRLGCIAMGATLWDPMHRKDSEDMRIMEAMARAESALKLSQEKGGDVVWNLLEFHSEDRVEPLHW